MTHLFMMSHFAFMSLAYVFGGFQLAAYATNGNSKSLILAFGAYILANLLLIPFLRSGAYGVLMTSSTIVVLIGHVLLSAFVMQEHYSLLQISGVVFAVISVVLIGLCGQSGSVS